ncbi:MAG: SigB/SigF/SigG family RNA polymerase sigma factor [Clostridia bacterium]|nr:SigB/SigF/SigG family RNA polymerase sigma factor [Clostridia bacterium]
MIEEFKPLGINETNELIEKAKNGDNEAKEKLIQGNFPLIKSIIKNYQNKGVDYDDLYQLGCVGFLKAINNFDEKFEVKFSTYAVPMIAGEIKRFLRDDGSIKVSRAIKALWIKIRSLLDQYKTKGESAPTIDEMAKIFEVDTADIVYAMDSAQSIISLNAQLDESSNNSQSVIDKVASDDKAEQLIDKILLKDAISKLPEREKKIILLRYFRGKTQSEVAELMGVSQVQISRIETKIISKLKYKLAE